MGCRVTVRFLILDITTFNPVIQVTEKIVLFLIKIFLHRLHTYMLQLCGFHDCTKNIALHLCYCYTENRNGNNTCLQTLLQGVYSVRSLDCCRIPGERVGFLSPELDTAVITQTWHNLELDQAINLPNWPCGLWSPVTCRSLLVTVRKKMTENIEETEFVCVPTHVHMCVGIFSH